MGHVQRRTDRPGWVARYIDPTGKERSKSFKKKVDAARYLTTMEASKLRGQWVDPELARMSFGTLAEQWVPTIAHMTASTRLGYESRLRVHVLPAFGEMELRAITPVVVRRWVADLQKRGKSRDMVRQAKQVLGAILKLAVEEGYITRDPTATVRLGKVAKSEKFFLTDQQVAKLASVIQEPYGLWVWFLAYSGLRWGEMAALRRRRVHGRSISVVQSLSESGGLHFKPTKNYESRTVLIPATVAKLLTKHVKEHVPEDPEALVFTSPGGHPLRNSNFQRRIWKPALKAAGLPAAARVHDYADLRVMPIAGRGRCQVS